MSKDSITMHDLNEIDRAKEEQSADKLYVCLTCKRRRECSDATPTVVMCQSHENDTNNQSMD